MITTDSVEEEEETGKNEKAGSGKTKSAATVLMEVLQRDGWIRTAAPCIAIRP